MTGPFSQLFDVLIHFVLPFGGVLIGLIVVHEAGHYFTAKLFGVRVLEAGIGFPPKIFSFKWHDTEYSLNALPLGAFVRMLGEEDPTHPDSLAAQPKWKRTVVIASGAFMNFVLAVVLFTVALMVPHDVSVGGAFIAEVAPDSPAERAGLKAGDQILEASGRTVENARDLRYVIDLSKGSTIDLLVKRTSSVTGAETLAKSVYVRWDPPSYTDECGIVHQQGPTGVVVSPRFTLPVTLTADERAELEKDSRKAYADYRKQVAAGAPASCYGGSAFGFDSLSAAQCSALDPQDRAAAESLKRELFPESEAPCFEFDPPQATEVITESRSDPPWTAFPNGLRLSFESLVLMRNQIWSWLRGYSNEPVTGPVGIAQATGEVVDEAGWKALIDLAALLSMNLALLNILPVPLLDGGRLVFIAIEFVRRGRRVAPEKEALVHLAGLVMLISLAAVITYFDIARIFRGDSLLR